MPKSQAWLVGASSTIPISLNALISNKVQLVSYLLSPSFLLQTLNTNPHSQSIISIYLPQIRIGLAPREEVLSPNLSEVQTSERHIHSSQILFHVLQEWKDALRISHWTGNPQWRSYLAMVCCAHPKHLESGSRMSHRGTRPVFSAQDATRWG